MDGPALESAPAYCRSALRPIGELSRFRFGPRTLASLALSCDETEGTKAAEPDDFRLVVCSDLQIEQELHALFCRALQTAKQPVNLLLLWNAPERVVRKISSFDINCSFSTEKRRKLQKLAKTYYSFLLRSATKPCPAAVNAAWGVLRWDASSCGCHPKSHVTRLRLVPIDSTLRECSFSSNALLLKLSANTGLLGDVLYVWKVNSDSSTVVKETVSITRLRDLAPQFADAVKKVFGASKIHFGMDDIPAEARDWLVQAGVLCESKGKPLWRSPSELIGNGFSQNQNGPTEFLPLTEELAERLCTRVLTQPSDPSNDDHAPAVKSVWIDAFLESSLSLPDAFRQKIQIAANQLWNVLATGYENTREASERFNFTTWFLTKYQENTWIDVDKLMLADWNCITGFLSRSIPSLRGESGLVDRLWPAANPKSEAYGQFISKIYAFCSRSQFSTNPKIVSLEAGDIFSTAPSNLSVNEVDALVRVSQDDAAVRVLIESFTAARRLTHRIASGAKQLRTQEESHREAVIAPSADSPESEVNCELYACPHNACDTLLSFRAPMANSQCFLDDNVLWRSSGLSIAFRDLQVMFCTNRRRFRFRSRDGQSLKLTYLTPVSPSFSLRLHFLRFLNFCASPIFTVPRLYSWEYAEEGITYMPRIQSGALILNPRRWSLPVATIWRRESPFSVRALKQITKLKVRLGLPDCVFAFSDVTTKPVYVDFLSPFGCALFCALANNGAKRIFLEEQWPVMTQTAGGNDQFLSEFVIPLTWTTS